MGNISSSFRNNVNNVNNINNINNKHTHIINFYERIDYIAAYYILTMNYKSLQEVNKKSYCNKLVKLISNIIDEELNDIEVIFLKKRIDEGVNNSIYNDVKDSDNIMDLNILDISKIDVFNIEQKNIKKQLCDEIAIFYVKLAHIFGSIVLTINPVYSFQDKNGKTKKTPLLHKDKIPKNVERNIHSLNICNKKITTTATGGNSLSNVFLEKNTCDVYNHSNEPKIQEIMKLYLDSNYDHITGNFSEMSPEMKKTYDSDLDLFYVIFTGNKTKPDNIHKFSDIPLSVCDKHIFLNKSILKHQYSNNDGLLVDYANNIKQMIQKATISQQKLLDIINEMFSFIHAENNEKQFRINPALTVNRLREITEKTRKLIIDLYINCELDYVNGAKIFEALVSSKILETAKKQIEFLEKEQKLYLDLR